MQTTMYVDDNSCNMYCRRRQFMQATIYAVTAQCRGMVGHVKKKRIPVISAAGKLIGCVGIQLE